MIQPAGLAVVGGCRIGQTASLAQLLEDDTVHAAAKVLVEQVDGSSVLGSPLGALVVVLYHIDVLGLVGSKQNLGLRRLLFHVINADRHGCKVLFGLVDLAQALVQLLLGHGTIINHGVLHVLHSLDQVEQFGRLGVAQLLGTHDVGVGVAGTVHAVLVQAAEALILVALGIVAGLDDGFYHILVGFFVNLGVLHQVLTQFQCLGHVLAQAAQRQIGLVVAHVHRYVAGQLVQALLELGSTHLFSAKEIQVAECGFVTVVGSVAEVILIGNLEQVIQGVLFVEQGQVLTGLAYGHLLAVVHKLRLDGLDDLVQDVLDEVALLVAVGGNGGNGGLVNLLLSGVNAHALIHAHVVVVQVTVGKVHDLLLGHAGLAVEFSDLLCPIHMVDEGVD